MVKREKKDVALLNSKEMQKLVSDSFEDMNHLTGIAKNAGVDSNQVKEQIQSIYLRNLKSTDEPIAIAKRLLAEGLTRMELQKMLDSETEFISKEFKQNVKLTSDLLKLVKDMEPKNKSHFVQIDDDKMVFPVVEGVYEEE